MARRRRTRRAYGSGTVYEKRPGAWVIAWKLWGGDAGYAWARKVVRQMEAADAE